MKIKAVVLMGAIALVSCQKDEDVSTSTNKGTFGKVVTTAAGEKYMWDTFQNGSQTVCTCYHLDQHNTWTAVSSQTCVDIGAGTNPCN